MELWAISAGAVAPALAAEGAEAIELDWRTSPPRNDSDVFSCFCCLSRGQALRNMSFPSAARWR